MWGTHVSDTIFFVLQLDEGEKMLLMMSIKIMMKFLMNKVSSVLLVSSSVISIQIILRNSFVSDIYLKMEAFAWTWNTAVNSDYCFI